MQKSLPKLISKINVLLRLQQRLGTADKEMVNNLAQMLGIISKLGGITNFV